MMSLQCLAGLSGVLELGSTSGVLHYRSSGSGLRDTANCYTGTMTSLNMEQVIGILIYGGLVAGYPGF